MNDENKIFHDNIQKYQDSTGADKVKQFNERVYPKLRRQCNLVTSKTFHGLSGGYHEDYIQEGLEILIPLVDNEELLNHPNPAALVWLKARSKIVDFQNHIIRQFRERARPLSDVYETRQGFKVSESHNYDLRFPVDTWEHISIDDLVCLSGSSYTSTLYNLVSNQWKDHTKVEVTPKRLALELGIELTQEVIAKGYLTTQLKKACKALSRLPDLELQSESIYSKGKKVAGYRIHIARGLEEEVKLVRWNYKHSEKLYNLIKDSDSTIIPAEEISSLCGVKHSINYLTGFVLKPLIKDVEATVSKSLRITPVKVSNKVISYKFIWTN